MNIILIACTILVAQSLLSFTQIRYYQKYLHQTAKQYAGTDGYKLYSAMERKKFGSSAIALMVIDQNHNVQNCQIMQGKSIFAKFKALPQFQNQNLSQIVTYFAEEAAIRKLSLWEKAIIKTVNNAHH